MTARCLSLLIAVLVAFVGRAQAARELDQYDIDSLSAMAKLIVKAEVGQATEVRTRDGDCAVWDVKVLATLHGDIAPQSVIRVAGIEEYRKGPGIEGADKDFKRLSQGDVVYLFLVPKGTRIGYAKYDLTDAGWKVIESGARLVTEDRVYAFGQYFPGLPGTAEKTLPEGRALTAGGLVRVVSNGPVPGFVTMTEETFPEARAVTVEEFEEQVTGSLAFVSELRRKLAENALPEAEQRAILDARAGILKGQLANRDYIPWLIYDEPRQRTTRP